MLKGRKKRKEIKRGSGKGKEIINEEKEEKRE